MLIHQQILHGEQYLKAFKPLPTSGTLTTESKIADIVDKGSGAVILTESKLIVDTILFNVQPFYFNIGCWKQCHQI